MKNVDSLGDRMKDYENVNRIYLTRRLPLILRIDGCHFHTYTKHFNKPFDRVLRDAMWETAKELCANISGAKLAYTQSDEISILITDYDNLDTEPWFSKNLQKMTSVAASMASIFFYQAHTFALKAFISECEAEEYEIPEWVSAHEDALRNESAIFDCRAFTLPKEEVNNYFLWRQQDCRRNSVEATARILFSDKELFRKSTEEMKEMMRTQKNTDWEYIPSFYKNGACVRKVTRVETFVPPVPNKPPVEVSRKRWEVDTHIPIFSKNPEYINELVNI